MEVTMDDFAKVVVLVSLLLIAFGRILSTSAHGCPENWEDRQAKIKAIIDAEVERAHELKLEEKKIEVLGRLKELGASKTYVRNYNKLDSNSQVNLNSKFNLSYDNDISLSNDNNS